MARNTHSIGSEASDFSRFQMDGESVAKKGIGKLKSAAVFVLSAGGTITEKTEGVHRIAKVAVSALAFPVLLIPRLAGIGEVESVFSGVKNFLDAIEVVGNVKEWGGYLKAIGQPRTWKITAIVLAIPKVTTTFVFTIANTAQLGLFVVPLAKGVFDATKYVAFAVGNVPVVGVVVNGLFALGMGIGLVSKGIDLVKAAQAIGKAGEKKDKWEEKVLQATDDKKAKVDSLKTIYSDKIKNSQDQITLLKKLQADYEAQPEVAPQLTSDQRKELKTLEAKVEKNLSVWQKRVAELSGSHAENAYNEIVQNKLERASVLQSNSIKMIVKTVVGSAINVAKIALIVASVAFLATGLVGLPFAIGLMTAGLAINVAGLGNFAWWEFWGSKPLPVRDVPVKLPPVAAPAA